MKKISIVVIVALLSLGIFYYLKQDGEVTNTQTINTPGDTFTPDLSNATFIFDGKQIELRGGRSENSIAGSALTEETTLLDIISYGDINKDGKEDAVAYFSQYGGGSGVFIYMAGYVSGPVSYKGSEAVFVGDRISPLSIKVEGGIVTINYLDRGEDEPYAAEPTIPKSMQFTYSNGAFVER